MMSPLRSARFPAVLLLLAAVAGLFLANSPLRDGAFALLDLHVGVPGVIEMSVRHVVSDGLLSVFFFVAAVELRHEMTAGHLASARRAALPAIAAAGGIVVPVLVYLAVAGGPGTAAGWPIPTATDIAFALGVLAVFGRGVPPGVRVFLLALAILDDIVGIVFIAVLSSADMDAAWMLAGIGFVVVFATLSARLSRIGHPAARGAAVAALIASAAGAWYAVHEAGVHATIAGVALGLAMAPRPGARARDVLEPAVNVLVLPAFALCAALVTIPAVPAEELSPAFWGVLIALPVGKLAGIGLAAGVAQRLLRVPRSEALSPGDLGVVGALGGIGFTVSLLLGDLVFAGAPEIRDQAVLGVLAGSAISLVLAAILVSWRAWHHRRATTTR